VVFGLRFLSTLRRFARRCSTSERFQVPVQYVVRPDANFRGFAGQVASVWSAWAM